MNSSRDNREYISVNSSVNEQISTLSFKPHISQRLIELEHPRTSLDHEVHHTMRDSYDDRASPSIRPSTANTLDYALWLEAGKHSHKPTYAKSLDSKPPINYNIWRNYRHYYAGVNGQNTARRSRAQTRLSEDTAFKYPIIIPAPSQLGENHLRNFFESNKRELFQNQSHFRMALIQADNDERMLRMLSLKSQQRKPPVAALSDHEASSSRLSQAKVSSTSTSQNQPVVPPQNSINVSPQHRRYDSGKKFVMRDNHPSLEKLKFEQELKLAISFHRELKRTREGNEKSLYARHQPV